MSLKERLEREIKKQTYGVAVNVPVQHAAENKWVFSCLRKTADELHSVRVSGRAFKSLETHNTYISY